MKEKSTAKDVRRMVWKIRFDRLRKWFGSLAGKTLWDWLGLLIIPAVLTGAALLFNQAMRTNEQAIASDRQREEVLQKYLDQMAQLLLQEKLLEKKDNPDDPVIDVAQIRTVTTLRLLDLDRKNILFQFLRDAGLADFILVKASLENADLSNTSVYDINLSEANLHSANLHSANLHSANLRQANLYSANLSGAYLWETNLNSANLGGATLSGAILLDADLTGADLSGAILLGTYLTSGNLRKANLRRVEIDDTTQINDKWKLVWEIVNQGAEGRDLSEADLSGADLEAANLAGANLEGANLEGADLRWTNLSEAKVSEYQLAKAESLQGATMPDGTIHE